MPNNYLDGVSINGTEYELRDVSVPGQIANKANDDGYYESMTVGQAEQLISTVGIEDKVPYNFRTSGGTADIGDRLTEKIVGGTVAWNQLMPIASDNKSKTANGVTITDKRDGSYSVVTESGGATAQTNIAITTFNFIPNHVYCIYGIPSTFSDTSVVFLYSSVSGGVAGKGKVIKNSSGGSVSFGLYVANGAISTTEIIIKPQIIDLTQMFGSTIADYLYTLETATPGAGVAWFRKLFPKPYYEYNAGELMSVQTSAHNMVGFNAWDGSNGVIVGSYRLIDVPTLLLGKCSMTLKDKDTSVTLPNGCAIGFVRADWEPSQGALTNQDYRWVYYSGAIRSNTSNTSGGTSAADGDKLLGKILIFPSTLAAFEAITSRFYLGVNLSWDGERDGEYEPYELHSYPLDSDLVLRGIPKLDASNQLYYDGDTYEADGTVTRRYGVVDLATLGWKANAGNTYMYCMRPSGMKTPSANGEPVTTIFEKYISMPSVSGGIYSGRPDVISLNSNGQMYIVGTTAPTGLCVYELTASATEEADPFQTPQIVNDFGTEEYVDAGERDVAIPVGHETYYQNNLRAKLEMAPDSPGDGDGDYVVRQTNGINEYVPLVIPAELPTNPSEDGEFLLKATVSNGVTTLSWVTQ